MRNKTNINDGWIFVKGDEISQIDIPHTWNSVDGQDGLNDYYRGICIYKKEFAAPELSDDEQVYLEFNGVNSSASVNVNGNDLYKHDGGYSTFRINVTSVLQERNQLTVSVDNSTNDHVYPQMADFTFYGGIYRDVSLIVVHRSHFSLDHYGSNGIFVTPKIQGNDATINVKAMVSGPFDDVRVMIDGEGSANGTDVNLEIKNVHLWNGLKDPHLYKVTAYLMLKGSVVDSVSAKFGCRDFHIDPEKGFFLNGKPYPLHGVSRHQDWEGVGNAITQEMQNVDMEMIEEIGANSIRLAHYQHDQYFYDLCDERGMIVWAEIPYITQHLPTANDNSILQMKELILQNYNHPSIMFWGLSNEITAAGKSDDLIENNRALNVICHELDPNRLTVIANVFMLETDSPIMDIPDEIAYNLYFGWYLGELEDNDEWFDEFHDKYPKRAIGLSEYGAEGIITWQTPNPEKGDYTEQYQALYHEHMIRMLMRRPYIWSSYIWNMFDFASDSRDEGGVRGRNNKGLVTFDRKVKKDSFFLYKAFWSREPFIHICGRRYVDRCESESVVKIYSNQTAIELYQNGRLVMKKEGDKIYTFSLVLEDENTVMARSGEYSDTIYIRRVNQINQDYIYNQKTGVSNWLDGIDLKYPKGFYSIKDKVGDICASEKGNALFRDFMSIVNSSKEGLESVVEISEELQMKMMKSLTLEFLINRAELGFAQVKSINERLNGIPKPQE